MKLSMESTTAPVIASQPGRNNRWFRIGTFPGEGNRQPHAYSRYYNPDWEGCVEYDVFAPSGKDAKRAAIAQRKRDIGA